MQARCCPVGFVLTVKIHIKSLARQREMLMVRESVLEVGRPSPGVQCGIFSYSRPLVGICHRVVSLTTRRPHKVIKNMFRIRITPVLLDHVTFPDS